MGSEPVRVAVLTEEDLANALSSSRMRVRLAEAAS
jgi:hypothetical protein